MKIFLASVALIIAATFVFEVRQLTKAVREPSVQVRMSVTEACQAHIAVNTGRRTRDCLQWIVGLSPIKQHEKNRTQKNIDPLALMPKKNNSPSSDGELKKFKEFID